MLASVETRWLVVKCPFEDHFHKILPSKSFSMIAFASSLDQAGPLTRVCPPA